MPQRTSHHIVLLFAASVLACISAFAFRPGQSDMLLLAEITALLSIGTAFVIPISPFLQTSRLAAPDNQQWQIRPLQLGSVIAGMGCLLLVTASNRPAPGLLAFAFGMHHPAQIILFTAGIVLITFGMMGRVSLPRHRITTASLWPLVAIMLLGFAVRIIALDSAVHYYVDEAHFVEAVTRLANKPDIQILTYLNPIANFTWIYPYIQRITVDFAGATLFGIRLASVFTGTLTIPALYLLVHELFDRKTALIAALLLASFPPHVHFSRLALNNIADPFFGVLATGLLLRALRTGSRPLYALAGLSLGMTQYFYEGGRVIFPLLVLLWLLIGWITKRHTIAQRIRRGVVLFLLTFILIAAPFYRMLAAFGASPLPRLDAQSVGGAYWTDLLTSSDGAAQIGRFLSERVEPAFLHLLHLPDGSDLYYGGDTGLILPLLVPLFILGIGFALRQWRRGGVLLLWVLLALMGNSLIAENTWTARFVVVFPALVILMALGLSRITDWISDKRSLSMLVIGISVGQIAYYFGPHLMRYNEQIRWLPDFQDAGFRAMDLPPETHVYLIADITTYPPYITIIHDFQAPDVSMQLLPTAMFPYDDMDSLPAGDYAFFLLPDDTATLERLQIAFGRRFDGPYLSPYNVPVDTQYALYRLVGWHE